MNERPAIQKLRQSGWTPDRRVDTAPDFRAFEKEGYPTFPVVTEFVRQCSGLRIPIDHGGPDEIWFSAERACGLLHRAWTEDYSRRAGTGLVPVGAAYREHLTLLVGENGNWFGGYDDEFGLLGEDVLSALDNLILDGDFVRRL